MLNVAMVSKWHVHAEGYAREINAQPDARVACVWDEDPARGRAWAADLRADFVADYEALLSRGDVDAVLVCAPTAMHSDLIARAARSGKHVFTEKVLALTSADCAAIAAAAEEGGATFTISFPHRCQPQDLFCKLAIEEGLLGKVTALRIRNCHDGALAGWLPDYWYDPAAAGGGAMMDLGAHGLYLAAWLLGEPLSVQSAFTRVTGRAVEDNAISLLRYESGAVAVTETSLVSPFCPVLLEVYGTQGVILCSDARVRLRAECPPGEGAALDGGWFAPALPEALPSPLRQFIDSALHGAPVRFGLEEARTLTRLMEAAYRAQAEGREARLQS